MIEEKINYSKNDISNLWKIKIVEFWWISHSIIKSLNNWLKDIKEIEEFYKKNLTKETKELILKISKELEKQLPENRKIINNYKILFKNDILDLSFLKEEVEQNKDTKKWWENNLNKDKKYEWAELWVEDDISYIYKFDPKNFTKEDVIKLQKALYNYWNYKTNNGFYFEADWVFWDMTKNALNEFIKENPEPSLIVDRFNENIDSKNKDKVIEIQKELKRLNYYTWEINWFFWNDTISALKEYRKKFPVVEEIIPKK